MPESAPDHDHTNETQVGTDEGISVNTAVDTDELAWPPCPSWCEHVQCREQDARDRLHQVARLIPVIVNEGGISSADVLATDMWVAIYTDVTHHGEIWVHLSDGEHPHGITPDAGECQTRCAGDEQAAPNDQRPHPVRGRGR